MIPGTLDAGGPLWGWDWDSDDDWDLAVLALLALAVVAATALALHWFGSGQDHEVGQPASTASRAQPPQAGDKLALHPKSKASGGGLEQQSPGQGKPEAPGQDQKSSATAGAQDQKPSTGRGMAPTDGLPLKTLGRVISRGVSGQQQANSAPGAPQDKERECSSPDSALLVRSKARGIPAPLLIHFTPRSPGSKMEAQVQEGGTGTKESACQAPACAEQKDTSSWHLSVKAPGSWRRDEGNFQWWLDSSSRDRTSHAPKPDPLRLGAAVSVWDVVDGAFKATQDSQAHSPCKSPPLPYSTPEPSGQDLTGASTTQIQLGANSSEDRQGGSNVQSSPTRAVCSGVKTKESRETGSSALRETQRVEAREGGWTWAAKEPALISSSFSCVPGMTGTQELPWELCSADQRDTEKQGSHPVREDWGSLKSQSSEQVARGSAADWRPPGPLKAHCWPTAGHSCSPSQSSPAPSSSQSLESGSPSETAACSPLSLLPVGLNHSHSLNEDKNLRASPVSLSAPILASAQVSTSVPTAVLAPFSFPSPAPVRTLTPTLIPASSPTALSVPSSPAASPLSPSPSSAPASAPAPVTVLTPISMPVSSPASPSGPASTPPSPLLSPPTSASAPGVAADSAVTSRSSLVPEEPSLHLSKGSQKGQVSTSWGNLIAMVLRSHPFPRQEQAQGSAPKAVPGTSPGPSTLLHAEDKQPSSLSEVPIPSPQDRCISSLGKGTKAGSGDLAETGCQPQSISFKTNGIPISSSLPGGKGDGTKEKTLDLLSPATMPTPLLQPSKETQPSSVPSSTTRQDSQPISRLQKGSICEIVQKSELVTTQTGPGKQRQVPAEGPSPADSREILREKQKEAQKLMFFLQRPGSWGVVEGLQKTDSRAATEAPWPRQVDLSNCLEVLAFAQQHGEPGLAQETYAVMSNNLLRVLGDPHLYRQLSGADRERILNLRTCQGQTVLGVLVLPSLYQVSRSGLGRPSPGEEAAAAGPAPLPPLTHLHVFIPQENSWRLLTQVPEEAPLRGCGLCTMHNYLFLAGGIRGSGTKAVCSNQVFCYNPLTNIWSQVRPMQQARAQLKLVALEGQLYAIGGECLYSMERYDPRTDTWTLRAPLPEGTFPVAHEAVACRGDIYVTGGHLFYRLLRYSPIKDLWVECPYSASHRRSSDMVALGGFLYRFDLLRGVGAAVMRYNTVTGSWSRAASLPLPDPAPLRCTVLGNTIYCLNHQVTATFTVSEGTAQFQAKELQPFPLGSKGILCPFTLTLPTEAQLQTAL